MLRVELSKWGSVYWRVRTKSLVAGFKIDSVFSAWESVRFPFLWTKNIENALDDRLIEESIPSFLRSSRHAFTVDSTLDDDQPPTPLRSTQKWRSVGGSSGIQVYIIIYTYTYYVCIYIYIYYLCIYNIYIYIYYTYKLSIYVVLRFRWVPCLEFWGPCFGVEKRWAMWHAEVYSSRFWLNYVTCNLLHVFTCLQFRVGVCRWDGFCCWFLQKIKGFLASHTGGCNHMWLGRPSIHPLNKMCISLKHSKHVGESRWVFIFSIHW